MKESAVKHALLILGLAVGALGQVGAWGQCGGQNWTGGTTCVAGYTCTYSNAWYSQCLPGSGTTVSSTSTSRSTSTSSSSTTRSSTSTSTSTTTIRSSTTASSTASTQTSSIPRATYTELTNFGSNPTGVRTWIYVPQSLVSNPPIVVGIHWCHGDANAFYTGTQFKTLSDQKGFIVIYPQAPSSDGCWDVHTNATLTHDAGGDSLGIVSAVRWTINNFSANKSRIYAVGTSSGAMMTNVLLGAYPDIFAAGSANAGVPYACFQGADAWNAACATGTVIKTAQQWGDLVRAGYPGYSGTRPKMQFWHGTADETLNYNNFGEEVKEWTNVFGVSTTPTNTVSNYAVSGWTRYDYGPNVMAISAAGVPHNIPLQETYVMLWFGL